MDMDWQVFDAINHKLLLATHAYGFNKGALKIIHSYLDNRHQRTQINKCFSSWSEILLGLIQSSVLGTNPLKYLFKRPDLFASKNLYL